MIPGNERAITAVQDALVRRGVDVITDDDEFTHVSGHPARDELRKLYKLVRPKYVVPTHGEWRHLSAQAALARGGGHHRRCCWKTATCCNSARARRRSWIPCRPAGSRWMATRIVPLKGGVLAARRRMLFNGVVVGSFVTDGAGKLLGAAKVSAPGLLDEVDGRLRLEIEAEFLELLPDLPAELRTRGRCLHRCRARRPAPHHRQTFWQTPARGGAFVADLGELNKYGKISE